MSAIAGVVRLDAAPVGHEDRDAVRAMLDAMAHRGSRADLRIWTDGPVALGMLPGSGDASLTWPRVSRDGLTHLICDARLDSRVVSGNAPTPAGSSDADVLTEVVGGDLRALPHVIGEFALAAWHIDQRGQRRLVLARDALALRSLYWARQGPYLWWASELQAMLAVPWAVARPCEAFIGELLSAFPVDLRATVFEGIERLPPAHMLIADARGISVSPYWQPPAFERANLSDRDHADRLDAILTEAVRCRLEGDPSSIGFQLSGGLDSSSVVALARETWPADVPLRTYSLIYPGLPAADEREYIDAMVAHVHATPSAVDPRGAARDAFLTHVVRYRDFPDVPHGEPLLDRLVSLARADGVRVMLTGAGGDLWLGGNLLSLAMWLRRGQLGRLAREMRAARPDTEWRYLVSAALLPNTPVAIKRALRPLVNPAKRPSWITPAFASRISLADRLRAGGTRGAGATPVIRESVARFWSGETAMAADRTARSAAWYAMDLRHPFLDRRVVETVMTLPDDQRAMEGLIKIVLRRAMGDRLPPLIRHRRSKAEATALTREAIESVVPDVWLRDPLVAQAGWVDATAARHLLTRMRTAHDTGAVDYDALAALWRICGAEAWLRHEQAPRSAAI